MLISFDAVFRLMRLMLISDDASRRRFLFFLLSIFFRFHYFAAFPDYWRHYFYIFMLMMPPPSCLIFHLFLSPRIIFACFFFPPLSFRRDTTKPASFSHFAFYELYDTRTDSRPPLFRRFRLISILIIDYRFSPRFSPMFTTPLSIFYAFPASLFFRYDYYARFFHTPDFFRDVYFSPMIYDAAADHRRFFFFFAAYFFHDIFDIFFFDAVAADSDAHFH